MGTDFRAIFEAEASWVVHSLRRLGVQERDLEDVAHEVFLGVHRRIAEYDPARPLRPWLFAFVFRFAADYRKRARHRRETIDDDLDPVDAGPDADEQLEAARARRLVLDALDGIDLDQRAVFVMHEIDGLSIPAVATALAIPVNTAYSRLRLARERFTAAVKRRTLRATSDAAARRTRGER
jgi:RNA polymerase sigma-70 factor (ECF subfamily)